MVFLKNLIKQKPFNSINPIVSKKECDSLSMKLFEFFSAMHANSRIDSLYFSMIDFSKDP